MTQTNNDVKPIESTDLFAPRWVWGYFARWWDCVDEMLDMEACNGSIPGVLAERWWYCDLYETECECIAETQAEAEAIFRHRYPWIEVFHVTLRGEYKPPAKKKAPRKSRRANDKTQAPT
jgi:hypothetical protein